MKGIDISHHHPDLDVALIKENGFDFVILRSNSGMSTRDKCFEAQYKRAAEVGLPIGVFVDSYAVTEDAAVREAQFALSILAGRPAQLGIYMDIEDQGGQYSLSNAQLAAVIRAFCQTIRAGGYTPGVYSSELGAFSKVDVNAIDAIIWAARYGREPNVPCDLWQMTNEGRINGYDRNLDIDIVRSSRFKALVKGEKEDPASAPAHDINASILGLQSILLDNCYPVGKLGVYDTVTSKQLHEFVDDLDKIWLRTKE